jgi:hypothetical protein
VTRTSQPPARPAEWKPSNTNKAPLAGRSRRRLISSQPHKHTATPPQQSNGQIRSRMVFVWPPPLRLAFVVAARRALLRHDLHSFSSFLALNLLHACKSDRAASCAACPPLPSLASQSSSRSALITLTNGDSESFVTFGPNRRHNIAAIVIGSRQRKVAPPLREDTQPR